MSGHAAALDAGVPGLPPVVRVRLIQYLDLVAAWSPRVNLTAARSPRERVEILLQDVVPGASLCEGRLLDIGSGNGSPGLVLAAFRPDEEVVLLEPRARRWAFLREAARTLGLSRVTVLRNRHDEYRGQAETVSLRAVRLELADLVATVAPGGLVLGFGTRFAPDARFEEQPTVTTPRSRIAAHRRRT